MPRTYDNMNIVIIMLGRKLGGIEQVALDYCLALQHAGCHILCVTDTRALINSHMTDACIRFTTISNWGAWDGFAAKHIRAICNIFKADAIISHGNRALNLTARARLHIPHITVAHNYLNKHFHKADAALCITHALQHHLIEQHQLHESRCFHMPNMCHITPPPSRTHFHKPVRIGTMGRMVHKKGFDVWLHALSLLKERAIEFDAWIAGDGEERLALETLCSELNLNDHVTFKGWIDDSRSFLENCDIFSLPSRHEPFGIVVLEAMNAAMPIIATQCEGPKEILTSEIGTLVPVNDAEAMAHALAHTIHHETESLAQGTRAYHYVNAHYNILTLSSKLRDIVAHIITLASEK